MNLGRGDGSVSRSRRVRHGTGSVRFRTTLAVSTLFALAICGASAFFVHHLQSTLVDDIHRRDIEALEELRNQFEQGSPPSSVLASPAKRPGTQVQVVGDDGEILASTPGVANKPLDPRFAAGVVKPALAGSRAVMPTSSVPTFDPDVSSPSTAPSSMPPKGPNAQEPNGLVPNGQRPNGQVPNGQGANGQGANGQPANELPPKGQLPVGPPNGPPPGAGAPNAPSTGAGATEQGATKPAAGAPGPVADPTPPGPPARPFTTVVTNPLGAIDANADEWAVTALPISTPGGTLNLVAATPLDSVSQSVDALTRALLVAIPALVALIGAAAWVMTGRALRPVEQITSRVEEISGSTLHERVPEPAANDEIAHLARTMNSMLERLESSSDRQRQFVSDASHELRSPVSSIRTELEVALLHPDGTNWREVAGNVLEEDARLERIVADLLMLARLDERPSIEPGSWTEVDLDEVVRLESARSRRLPVDASGIRPAKVRGRADELARLVGHVLDNAARHGEKGVVVRVDQIEPAGDRTGLPPGAMPMVVLTVDDDGPGVPAAERDAVFERFGRLEEGRARDKGGAGLGLAVVRRIAERHGGVVRITGNPAGGARVEAVFPAVIGAGGPVPPPPE